MNVHPYIQSLVPYKPGKPIEETKRELGLQTVYKLASNENPLGPSPKVVEAIREAALETHRYPDPSCHHLVRKMCEVYQASVPQLAVGNGSNELIDLLIRIYCEPGEAIITSKSAFIAYQICAQAARVDTLHTNLTEDLVIDLDEVLKTYRDSKGRAKVIFLPNPNNPTGTYFGECPWKKFLDEIGNDPDVLIVMDEAYFEYVEASDYQSSIPLMTKYKSLCVLRTMSKAYGLSGLRIGALIAQPEVIELVHKVRHPFNINNVAQAGALAAFDDQDYIRRSVEMNRAGKSLLAAELGQLGIEFLPTQGNFILMKTKGPGADVFTELLKQGVITRPVAGYGLVDYLRVSIGTEEENRAFLAALKKLT